MSSFDDLSTEQFRKKLSPHLDVIYFDIFGEHQEIDLRGSFSDKFLGADRVVCLPSGRRLVVQEKIRNHDALRWGDFTQEYKNGVGTPKETLGEWFRLCAHLYFYGWANEKQDGFQKWFVMDVRKYTRIVEAAGGLEQIGAYRLNYKHGRASFYAIPLFKIKGAIILDSAHSAMRTRELMTEWLKNEWRSDAKNS